MKSALVESSRVKWFSLSIVFSAILWSLLVAALGAVVGGVLGIVGWGDQIPLLGWIATSKKVVGISGSLAVVATFAACVRFFEDAGVLIGFIILSSFGLVVVCASIWFGHHAFNFIRTAIAGAVFFPAISFPLTYWIVAKNRQ